MIIILIHLEATLSSEWVSIQSFLDLIPLYLSGFFRQLIFITTSKIPVYGRYKKARNPFAISWYSSEAIE